MKKKALRLKVDLEISRISCPGVFFQCKGPVSTFNKARDATLYYNLAHFFLLFCVWVGF